MNKMFHIRILFPLDTHVNKIFHQIHLAINQLINHIQLIGTVDVLQVLALQFLDELWIVGVGDLVGADEFLDLFELVLTDEL